MSIIGFNSNKLELNHFPGYGKNSPSELAFIYKDWNRYKESDLNKLIETKVKIEEHDYYFMTGDSNFLKGTPLYTHNMKSDDDLFGEIKEALLFLKEHMPLRYDVVKKFIKVISVLEIDPSYTDVDSTITSCSLPTIPFIVFLSEKALYHIPPSNISESDFKYILAENIYHEAIHQMVNISILTKDILPDDYSSDESIKVPIPWRINQKEPRNKQWELDRVLHAMVVYANVIPYRKELISEKLNNNNCKDFFEESLEHGLYAFDHLLNSIIEYKNHFGSDGIKIIEETASYYNDQKNTLKL